MVWCCGLSSCLRYKNFVIVILLEGLGAGDLGSSGDPSDLLCLDGSGDFIIRTCLARVGTICSS